MPLTDASRPALSAQAEHTHGRPSITLLLQTTDCPDGPAGVEILTDAGYQGLGAQSLGQVITPTSKHQKKRLERIPGIAELRDAQRKAHARRRVRVEHTIAHMKNWRALSRHLGRRDTLDDSIRAAAGLLSGTTI